MNYDRTVIKIICNYACKCWYGFAPSAHDIVLLESSGDGGYVLFKVGKVEHLFVSNKVVVNFMNGEIDLGDYELQRLG
jgi:hypothetical protein